MLAIRDSTYSGQMDLINKLYYGSISDIMDRLTTYVYTALLSRKADIDTAVADYDVAVDVLSKLLVFGSRESDSVFDGNLQNRHVITESIKHLNPNQVKSCNYIRRKWTEESAQRSIGIYAATMVPIVRGLATYILADEAWEIDDLQATQSRNRWRQKMYGARIQSNNRLLRLISEIFATCNLTVYERQMMITASTATHYRQCEYADWIREEGGLDLDGTRVALATPSVKIKETKNTYNDYYSWKEDFISWLFSDVPRRYFRDIPVVYQIWFITAKFFCFWIGAFILFFMLWYMVFSMCLTCSRYDGFGRMYPSGPIYLSDHDIRERQMQSNLGNFCGHQGGG